MTETTSPATIGRRRWAIAEGYLPEGGLGGGRALVSQETACILNAGPHEAHVVLTVFFAERALLSTIAWGEPAS